jgi:hypothetical protein
MTHPHASVKIDHLSALVELDRVLSEVKGVPQVEPGSHFT